MSVRVVWKTAPGKSARCSLSPNGTVGPTTAVPSGQLATAARANPSAIRLSVSRGRCGPCCSIVPTGTTTTASSAASRATSGQVSEARVSTAAVIAARRSRSRGRGNGRRPRPLSGVPQRAGYRVPRRRGPPPHVHGQRSTDRGRRWDREVPEPVDPCIPRREDLGHRRRDERSTGIVASGGLCRSAVSMQRRPCGPCRATTSDTRRAIVGSRRRSMLARHIARSMAPCAIRCAAT